MDNFEYHKEDFKKFFESVFVLKVDKDGRRVYVYSTESGDFVCVLSPPNENLEYKTCRFVYQEVWFVYLSIYYQEWEFLDIIIRCFPLYESFLLYMKNNS